MVNTRYVIKVDLNDSWAEIKISIVAHKLLIEKYDFDQNRCQFGNFANVPTTGCMKLKINVTYVYFISGWRRLNILYIIYVHYDYIHLLYIYSTVITTVSHCCFTANPQYLVH